MIALIDSGVGGLTVMKALKKMRPDIPVVYIADDKNFPYGLKTPFEIQNAIEDCLRIAYTHPISQAFIACHTASIALSSSQFPFIRISDATIDLIQQTPVKGRVALMGTKATIKSGFYQNVFEKSGFCHVKPFAKQNLVQLIESNCQDVEIIVENIRDIISYEPDQIFLGSTHFPHIKPILEQVLPNVSILDPSEFFAKRIADSVQSCLDCEDIFISTNRQSNLCKIT